MNSIEIHTPELSRLFCSHLVTISLCSVMLLSSSTRVAAQQGAGSQAAELDEILVVDKRLAAGYSERRSSVGLGFEADSLRVPQSVTTITQNLIADQQPLTLSDVVRNTAGVGAPRNSVEPFNSFKLRGFDITESATDGIRNTNALNIQAGGLANVEQVEVLRGPGGAVYGLGSPGGVVNVVTKKPTSEAQLTGSVRLGNFDFRQLELDLGGPLAAETGLNYRLIAQYEDRDSFVDFVGVESWQIAPSVQWTHASGWVARYQGDWRRREGLRYISLPLEGTLVETDQLQLRRSLFTGEPAQGDAANDTTQHTLVLEKSGSGSALSRFYVRRSNTDYDQPSVAPASVQADGRTLTRRFNQFIEEQEESVIGGLMVREFDALGILHTVSAGADFADWSYDSEFIRGAVGPLDLLDPVYGSPINILFVLAESEDSFRQTGAYVQNYVAVGNDVNVLLGLRFDRLSNATSDLQAGTQGKRTDTQWSPRLGLSWEPITGIAPFVSYSRTFVALPNFGFVRTPDGNPLGPQRGAQVELGVKFDLFSTLTATAAVFEIEQTNVPTVDPDDPFFRIPTGKQRSRGLELSGAWTPGDIGLSVMWAYAYTQAEVTRDTTIAPGSRLDNVPRHTARLWSRYARPLAGDWVIGATGGLQHNGATPIAIGGALELSSFTVFEGGLFASRGPLIAEIKVDNLGDRDYLLRGAFGGNGVIPGDARRVVFSLGWRPR